MVQIGFRPVANTQSADIVLNVQNPEALFGVLVPNLQNYGINLDRAKERQLQIEEKDVTIEKIRKMNISDILEMIGIYENAVSEDLALTNIQALLNLYSQAIEYYSAIDDPQH